jgi:hypothetical protein
MRFPPPTFRIPTYVVLMVSGVGVFLDHEKRTFVMTTLNVGHQDAMSIVYLDTNGNPMLTTPVPDSPPVWTNAPSDPSVDTFTPSVDGTTAVLVANAPGSDTVSLSATVGGKTCTASVAFQISAAPQTLGSISINEVVT